MVMECFFLLKKNLSRFMLLTSFLVLGMRCGETIILEASSNPQQIGKCSLRGFPNASWYRAALQRAGAGPTLEIWERDNSWRPDPS